MSIGDKLLDLLRPVRDLAGQLEAMCKQIERLKIEREDIATALAPREEVKDIMLAWMRECGAAYQEQLARQVHAVARKPAAFQSRQGWPFGGPLGIASIAPNNANPPTVRTADVAISALLGHLIAPKLVEMLDAIPWPGAEGLPQAARSARLAELDRQIAALEAEQAEFLAAAAAHGVSLG